MRALQAAFVAGAGLFLLGCGSSVSREFQVNQIVPESDPSEVDAVLFLLGDAGATDPGASPVLAHLTREVEKWSGALARDSAVSVAYLGDLVYPDGIHDRDHPDFEQDSTRLWNQIEALLGPNAAEHNSAGLFLAGNHDWGNMTGEEGLARLLNLREQIDQARAGHDVKVSLLPGVMDAGPVIRDLRNNVRLIFVDTHWWLQEQSLTEKNAFFDRVAAAVEESGDREVIILAHHPWASAGPHGVVASGTRALGFLYLLSKSGTYVQDVNAPTYDDFRDRMRGAFDAADKVPLIYAAGHDHSLQVLRGLTPGDPRHILVSGAGSKLSSIEDTTGLAHAAVQPGYMKLLFRRDDAVDLFVHAGSPDFLSCSGEGEELRECMAEAADSFQTIYSARLLDRTEAAGDTAAGEPSLNPEPSEQLSSDENEIEGPVPAIEADRIPLYADSVVATPGIDYTAGSVHRWLMGDLNRDLWSIPFKVAVLNLDAVGGSLEVDELSGGKQTLGLKFDGADGRRYQFRSIIKDPSRALPDALASGPVDDALQDQMAAQFPLSAMVVAELLSAAGILVATPRPVIMPDDERLGEYRELFAGRMGWIEERPNEEDGDEPGFAGSDKITGGEALYETLQEDPESFVNQEALLRARLIDLFVNDWDRHYDNWRWASFEEGDRIRWDPIPRDRDWALARIDGIVPRLASVYYPKYVGFGPNYPSIKKLTWSAQNLDRRLLNAMTRQDFERVAQSLQTSFTDDVLRRAVGVLPPEYQEVVGERLLADLQSRRDQLPQAAAEFYELLSPWVDIRGTEEADYVRVRRGAAGSLRITMESGEDRHQTFDRTFIRTETREIRIYLFDGDDMVEFEDGSNLPIRLKIVAGDGDDLIVANGGTQAVPRTGLRWDDVTVWDDDPAPMELAADLDEDDAQEQRLVGERPTFVWDHRDWGREWISAPSVDYASEYGLHLGGSVTRRGFGFGADPFRNEVSLTVLGATSPSRLVARFQARHTLRAGGSWFAEAHGRAYTQRLTRFFGFGNETTNDLAEESYETRRSLRNLDLLVAWRPEHGAVGAWFGPRVRRWGWTDVPDPTVFQLFPTRGSGPTTLLGATAGAERDTRDHASAPTTGSLIRAEMAGYAAAASVEQPWAGVSVEARRYAALPGFPGEPAVHLAVQGQAVSDEAPYFERASLGGRTTLPGLRTGRFRGDQSLSAMVLLRAQVARPKTPVGRFDLGVHGLAAAGRVWLAGEESTTVHTGYGGGLWFRSRTLNQVFSVTVAHAERGPRTYLDLGFPF